MSEMKTELDELERLIEARATNKSEESASIKKVNRKKILEQLKNAEKEIMDKHKESKKLWKKSIDLYTDFIKKNPGSKQVNPPANMPEEPKQADEIRGYIKLFESMVDEETNISLGTLKEIFKTTSEGIQEAKHTAYLLTAAASGSAVMVNQNW
jgi:ElaB/YqjD/DUF883 family membrane-anchored ribosome-binding protein